MGSLCAELSRIGFETVGVENDTKGVELARLHHPEISFYNYGVQDDPSKIIEVEKKGKYDAVVSAEVIEHLFRRIYSQSTQMGY